MQLQPRTMTLKCGYFRSKLLQSVKSVRPFVGFAKQQCCGEFWEVQIKALFTSLTISLCWSLVSSIKKNIAPMNTILSRHGHEKYFNIRKFWQYLRYYNGKIAKGLLSPADSVVRHKSHPHAPPPLGCKHNLHNPCLERDFKLRLMWDY